MINTYCSRSRGEKKCCSVESVCISFRGRWMRGKRKFEPSLVPIWNLKKYKRRYLFTNHKLSFYLFRDKKWYLIGLSHYNATNQTPLPASPWGYRFELCLAIESRGSWKCHQEWGWHFRKCPLSSILSFSLQSLLFLLLKIFLCNISSISRKEITTS